MPESFLYILTFLTALGCGINAGLFFVFSNTIMTALERLRPAEGGAAMREINRVILNPVFFSVFFGTAVGSLLLIVAASRFPAARGYLTAGGACYLVGCIVVTVTRNVPLNEALQRADPGSPDEAALWARYLKEWTAWNHVRTVACVLAAGLFTLALTVFSF
ncbi:MAG: DUF1772 domain-containing protein [Candidatus Omnitrophica bacterium]|nr:DUF1772 domain-containing protein [Candidatus Omnitrophota bacterium]